MVDVRSDRVHAHETGNAQPRTTSRAASGGEGGLRVRGPAEAAAGRPDAGVQLEHHSRTIARRASATI
jgi:hypothetical protein